MGNTSRFVVNAIGKGGETYYTHFNNKQELKNWLSENKDRLSHHEIRITDRSKNPLMKLLTFKK